ncbi:rhomboid family intramembrane serine protease [Pareuzebyella sediminis]|uniref:rhomboid family intramembrane serine protease n=1 Tax=Pareuzebyella sediminis TaxID=2607998 RepID=UPI0011EDD87C|nr:rhomboid family intramembrane serine protease [Pareuzebyella sediminis]
MANGGLRYQYARLSVSEKLIAVNVIVFIVMGLITALIGPNFEDWFALPKDFYEFLLQPWSLITYSFLHGGILHILWNMYILYVAGRILLNLFDGKRFLNVYFLGVILGGLLFLLSYNIFPALVGINTSLIGASAGVMAVLIFVCTYIPNQEIRVFFFNVKLWQVGVFVVLLDLIQIPLGGNVGGRIAHLGGALLGYVYARQLYKGTDIGEGFSKFMDGLANLFKKKEKKAPMKTVYRKQNGATKTSVTRDKQSHQKKIDAILDKISKSGYESLSKAEKDFLFKAGKED